MRRLSRWLCSPDAATQLLLLAVCTCLWCVRVQGPASQTLDPFGNSDQYTYFYPLHRLVAERLRRGALPLWNPQQLAGVPLLATPQSAVFYPPNLLHLWLPSERVFELLAFVHLWWAALSTYALCRTLGAMRLAAAIGGCAYAWSSYVVGCHLWPPCLAALAWFPLPLIGVALQARAPARSALCVAAGVAALVVCGHLPLASFGLQAAAAYGAFCSARLARAMGIRAAVSVSARTLLAALAGALLAAPQWLPTLELMGLATRNPHGLTSQQLEPFGALRGAALSALFSPAVRGGGYASAAALLMLPLSPIASRREHRADALFFALLALCFALVSLGSTTPLYALYTQLPGTRLFRGPVRAMCLFVLGAAVSGALCLHGWLTSAQQEQARVRWLGPALLGAGALVLCVALPPPTAAIALAFAVALALIPITRGRMRTLLIAAVGGIVLCDLALIPTTPDRQIWRKGALAPLTELAAPYRELAAKLGPARCLVQPARSLATAPRVAAQSGLRVFEDYEPLSLQRYADYASFMQYGHLYEPSDLVLMYAGAFERRTPWLHRRLLTAAGVRAIARVRKRPEADLKLEVEWLADAVPRAYISHELRPAQSPTSTLRQLARGELGGNAVALEHLPLSAAARQPANAGAERAVLIHDEPERVVIDVTLAAPGALVLLDASYPGWHARVDGAPTAIYTANYLFRAVLLGTGTHRVTFDYVCQPLRTGLALCALGLVLVVALVLRTRTRKRPHARVDGLA